MRQLKKKSGTESVNDSSSIPRISTPSPCHTQSPSQQGPEALSQPQGHETPPQQGQGQQPKYAQAEEKKLLDPFLMFGNILLRMKMVGLIVSTIMHYVQQLVLSMEPLT